MCSTSVRSRGGKSGKAAQLVAHHPHADGDVAQQLAFVGVGEAALVVQLVDLADIVQDHAGEQQVEIDVRVVRRGQAGQRAQREHVLDQAAEEGVVDLLGGGRDAVAARDVRIVEHGIEQRLQMRIAQSPATMPRSSRHISSGSRLDDGK